MEYFEENPGILNIGLLFDWFSFFKRKVKTRKSLQIKELREI